MITQRVRLLNEVSKVFFFELTTFYKKELYELTPLPGWITIENPTQSYIEDLLITPIATGTYTYYFTLGGSPSIADACLIIEIVDSITDTVDTCNNSNYKCLVWITREGGRDSCMFDQRKDYGVSTGQTQTFDNGGVVKYLSKGKSFDMVTIYKTGVSNTEIDKIEGLRQSIQAWEYNPTTDVSTPILLDSDSYSKYSTKNRLNEIKLRYRIAKYKEVQSQ